MGTLHWPETWGGHILLAGLLAGVCVCVDLENFGPRNADAFESKHEVKIKPVNLTDWLSIKVEGTVLNLNSAKGDTLTPNGFKMLELVQVEKGAVSDTRVTLGVWEDWVRLTYRQAVSSYITPGTDLGYFRQSGLGFENGATSQRIETAVWKTDSMRLSAIRRLCPGRGVFHGSRECHQATRPILETQQHDHKVWRHC